MKICISATGESLDSQLDFRFGRAFFFLILNEKGQIVKKIKNSAAQTMRGAGIAAAQLVVNEGIEAVISGNIGPNAFMVLKNSGIRIFIGNPAESVKDNFNRYLNGELKESEGGVFPPPGFGRGGRGLGRGFNQGMGRGPGGGYGGGGYGRGAGRGLNR